MKEPANEDFLNGISHDALVRYIRTGEYTPKLYLAMSDTPVSDPPEPCDQSDGFAEISE